MHSRICAFSRCFAVAVALLALTLPAHTQTSRIPRQEPNRVLWPVTSGNAVPVADRLPAYVRNFAPTGKPSPDTVLTNLMVLLSRSPQTQAAFDQFVLDQQDPNSQNFHHFLAPITVGQMFGPTLSDVQAVASWLGTQGLQVDEISPDMTRVVFHGTVANVSSAFNVAFGTFNLQTARGPETRLASLSAPSVPMALSPVIQSIIGLYADPLVSYETGNEFPTTANSHNMTPASFKTQYGIGNILSAGYTGTGVRVAILGYSRVLAQDITDFMNAMVGADSTLNVAAQPNQIVPPTGTDPGVNGNQGEQTLDVTRMMSTAPGAIADLVVSGTSTGGTDGLIVDLNYEINTLIDPILTMSYGGCETVQGLASVNAYAALFQTAVAEGITPLIAAGDSGAECGGAWLTNTNVPTTPIVGVNWLCANPYATCVGGTSLNDQPQVYVTPAGNGAALAATVTGGAISAINITRGGSGYSSPPTIRIDGGGGTGATATATLTSGVITGITITSGGSGYKSPSTYWNDTGANFSTLLGVVPEGSFDDPETIDGRLQVGGSTGGFSTFASRPSFQTTALAGYAAYAAAPFAGQRLVPDIAFSADVHDGYFMCINLDCENGTFSSEAGTSAASPDFAGIMALVVNRAGSQGWFNPTLYSLASAKYSQDFHDVTPATAGVAACAANVPSHCNNDEPYLDGSTQAKTAYMTGTGYDVVTGWGSVNAYNMLLDLRPPSPYNSVTYTTTSTSFGTTPTIVYGSTLSSNLNAKTQSSGVDITAKGVESYFATISGGAPVAINSTTLLSPGSYSLTAIWQPTPANAGTYSDSYGVASQTVSKGTPTVVVTATSSSINLNATDDFTATLTGVSGGATPTGTVQFFDGTTAIGGARTIDGAGKAKLLAQTFTTAGPHTITAKFATDANYLAATSGNFALTVIQNTPTVTATATPSTITTGGSSALAATVTSSSGTPTGTVQFYDGAGTVGSPVTLASGAASLAGQVFTTVGAHSITAQYSGDATYAGVTSSATILTVNKATPTVTVTAASTNVPVNTADTITVTVIGTPGTPTGTVQFYNGSTAIGSAVTLVSSAATLTGQTFTTAGVQSITAQYSGDATFAAATSPAFSITVGSPTVTFAVPPNVVTITKGYGASISLIATSTFGFTGSVPLACTVAYTGSGTSSDLPVCTLTPSSLTLASNGTATSIISLVTVSPHDAKSPVHAQWITGGSGILACLLLFVPLRRRRVRIAGLLLALFAFAGALSGCSSADPGTASGGYTVTVKSTSSSAPAAINFTITVN